MRDVAPANPLLVLRVSRFSFGRQSPGAMAFDVTSTHGTALDANRRIGRNLDANAFQFVSENKSLPHKHLTACNAIFGRIGRKFPEHFFWGER